MKPPTGAVSRARWRIERMSLWKGGRFYGAVQALKDENRRGRWRYVSSITGMDGTEHATLAAAKRRVERPATPPKRRK